MKKLYPIAIEAEVKQALGKLGHAGESYNKVLKRLLDMENKREPLSDGSDSPSQTTNVQSLEEGKRT